ncbi:DUF3471 domain-containing protein [Pontibacter liquoris]|uniref:DUF3471 domain-containing protein n=1 Tax=Pontibacter liquoris TaxID=2905677 RepID=UPI001FA7CCAF|nr:DUF3471 domain-containing protein [Pontibacter liquoris]
MKKLCIMLLLCPVTLFAANSVRPISTKLTRAIAHPQRTATAVGEEELQRFAGVYALNEQFAITISVEDGRLYGLAPGDAEKTEFVQVSGNKFRIKGPETEAEFLEEKGQVQYLFVNMQGGLKFKKIK